jgi:heat shock protein HslJ
LPETEISVLFEKGTVNGSAGCNSYGANYLLCGPNLALEAPAVTEIACLEPASIMEQEQRYRSTLAGPTRYFIHGQRL